MILLMIVPGVVSAQDFTFITNNGAITITGYTGSGGVVAVPASINGLPVTTIGTDAFYDVTRLTGITLPSSLVTIEAYAFSYCTSLSSLDVPNNVTSIGDWAFWGCDGLGAVTLGGSVTLIGAGAFFDCTSLTTLTFPDGVASIGPNAFAYCTSLASAHFLGNAPSGNSTVFSSDNNATVYYLPGAAGWGSSFGGLPTAVWTLPYPVILNPGLPPGAPARGFSFTISWASNAAVAVEASASLANPLWQPLQTNNLNNGSLVFSDPQWTNFPTRFYRVRSP